MSMILTGHYPTDGIASEPAAVDKLLCEGNWPERKRIPEPDDLPITALGEKLNTLFDLAFSLDPNSRPGPDQCRQALTHALQNCWIHHCGQAFVAEPTTNQCPGCSHEIKVPQTVNKLKIRILPKGLKYGVKLRDRQPVILGRETITGLPATVSARHIELLPLEDQLLLRHTGTNPTLIEQDNAWYRLDEYWVSLNELQTKGITLALADVQVQLEIA